MTKIRPSSQDSVKKNQSSNAIQKKNINIPLNSALISAVSLVGIFLLMLFNLLLNYKIQWEYKNIEFTAEIPPDIITINERLLSSKTIPDISAQISKLGQEGWELTGSYLEHETTHPNFGNREYVTGLQPNLRPQKLVLIFKRQKRLF